MRQYREIEYDDDDVEDELAEDNLNGGENQTKTAFYDSEDSDANDKSKMI